MRYPTAGGGLEFVRLAFVGHSRPRLSIPGGLSDQVRDGPALYPATQFEVLPRVRGTSGELLNQCTRVQHPPMLDHLAVFDAELVGDPKVGCEVGCCHDGQPFELFDEHQPSVVAPRALAWLSPLHMEANEVTFQLRDFAPDDWHDIYRFFTEIVDAGETYAYPEQLDFEQARRYWVPPPPVGPSSAATAAVLLVRQLWARTGRAAVRTSPPPASWSTPLIMARAPGAP